MGNRAVITTENNFNNNGVGVYLHWNGGRDSVEAFLAYCKMKGYRPPDQDNYGWARLCQVIGNFFGGTTSIGIDTVNSLDCDNFDNGVYIIEGWNIIDRKYIENTPIPECGEQKEYDLYEMLDEINNCQPVRDQIDFDTPSDDIKKEEKEVMDKELEILAKEESKEFYQQSLF